MAAKLWKGETIVLRFAGSCGPSLAVAIVLVAVACGENLVSSGDSAATHTRVPAVLSVPWSCRRSLTDERRGDPRLGGGGAGSWITGSARSTGSARGASTRLRWRNSSTARKRCRGRITRCRSPPSCGRCRETESRVGVRAHCLFPYTEAGGEELLEHLAVMFRHFGSRRGRRGRRRRCRRGRLPGVRERGEGDSPMPGDHRHGHESPARRGSTGTSFSGACVSGFTVNTGNPGGGPGTGGPGGSSPGSTTPPDDEEEGRRRGDSGLHARSNRHRGRVQRFGRLAVRHLRLFPDAGRRHARPRPRLHRRLLFGRDV